MGKTVIVIFLRGVVCLPFPSDTYSLFYTYSSDGIKKYMREGLAIVISTQSSIIKIELFRNMVPDI